MILANIEKAERIRPLELAIIAASTSEILPGTLQYEWDMVLGKIG
jgi:hypothetical protein